MNDAKETLKKAMNFINGVLASQTFLVGERVTYADISVCLTLRSAYENVFTADFRKARDLVAFYSFVLNNIQMVALFHRVEPENYPS